jgi:hypothetical protein
MRQDYTMRILKADKRTKSGLRTISTTVWCDRDHAGMERECDELSSMYPESKGYSFEFLPVMRLVRNLMTGGMVLERSDLPYSCSVASESYWST